LSLLFLLRAAEENAHKVKLVTPLVLTLLPLLPLFVEAPPTAAAAAAATTTK
jgi:hypothetical protein